MAQVQVDKVEKAYRTEKKFLTTRLQDLTNKAGGNDIDLAYAQKRYERVMSTLDQVHLDSIVKAMGSKHMKVLDMDISGAGSVSEMQAWVELAAKIDVDNNGLVRGNEDLMWIKTVEENTIWLGNIYPNDANERFLRHSLSRLSGSSLGSTSIIACTVKRCDKSQEKLLNASTPDKNGLVQVHKCSRHT